MTWLDALAQASPPAVELAAPVAQVAAVIAAVAALVGAVAALVRRSGDAIAAQVADLRTRVQALEKELHAERDARTKAEQERDLERTGKYEALREVTAATARLELVERDAERRIREALRAVEQSAKERALWEARAKWATDELDRHVKETTSGTLTPGHEPEGWAEQDTWPPARG